MTTTNHDPLVDGECLMSEEDLVGTILEKRAPKAPWSEEERISVEYADYVRHDAGSRAQVDWNSLDSIFGN
jgi:hypothetical protein